jgi:hypothetical protein
VIFFANFPSFFFEIQGKKNTEEMLKKDFHEFISKKASKEDLNDYEFCAMNELFVVANQT